MITLHKEHGSGSMCERLQDNASTSDTSRAWSEVSYAILSSAGFCRILPPAKPSRGPSIQLKMLHV